MLAVKREMMMMMMMMRRRTINSIIIITTKISMWYQHPTKVEVVGESSTPD